MLLYQRMELPPLAAATFHVCTPTICTATGSTLWSTGLHTRNFASIAHFGPVHRKKNTRDALWYNTLNLPWTKKFYIADKERIVSTKTTHFQQFPAHAVFVDNEFPVSLVQMDDLLSTKSYADMGWNISIPGHAYLPVAGDEYQYNPC